jgi:inosine/xanthosine triphosphate pyrophosphatase family protein
MKELLLASGNGGKLREIQAILGRLGCGVQTQDEMPEFRQATVKGSTLREPWLSKEDIRDVRCWPKNES